MINLSVNLNKVALLRNQRDVGYPSVERAAKVVLAAGAQGITVHPRPDERHIRRSDVVALTRFLGDWPDQSIEFNVEGYPTPDFLELVGQTKPHQVTLVPDAPDQATSDHGWDVAAHRDFLEDVIQRLQEFGCRVSLFLDPDEAAIRLTREIGADRMELYTGPYAHAHASGEATDMLRAFAHVDRVAGEVGLGLNAGHDLTLDNLPDLCRAMPSLAEVSIGHALTAEALWVGFDNAVRAYLRVLR
ncbi:MAG: pyridoxine 5'-phosphate synthase [Pseudomonadota bacterium]